MATMIDTTSPYISSYTAKELHSVDNLSGGQSINKSSKSSLDLGISTSLQIHDQNISQSIANSTSGIALANIAQNALYEQSNILNSIKELTIQALDNSLNNEDRQVIASQLEQLLQGFEAITDSTNYNGEKLLKTKGDSSDDLSIVAEEKIVSIYKVDTTSISDSLRTFLGEFPINPKTRENMLNVLGQNINELSNFANDFTNTSKVLENMVKNQLTDASKSENIKSIIANTDYAQEVTDFNKTNLLSQAGYLMQTQANAHTQRTVAILK